MGKLTNARDTAEIASRATTIVLPVKGATTIYQGSIVAIGEDGYAVPGSKAENLKAAGRAEETVENKGADGEASITVSRGVFIFENSSEGALTAADVLGPCYIEDEETVTKTAKGASVAGLVVRVDAEGVAVEMGFGYSAPGASAAAASGSSIKKLGDLEDVDLTTGPTDNQVLKYNNSEQKWKAADDATEAV